VVVWTDNQRDNQITPSIYAQLFDNAGNAVTGEFIVNQTTDLTQTNPSVAMDNAGNFVVTWETDIQVMINNVLTTLREVRARRFNAAGAPLGAEFTVNTTQFPNATAANADVAIDPDSDEFVIVWRMQVSGSSEVFGQRFNAAGAKVGNEFQVNVDGPTSQQSNPHVAMDAGSNFVVSWQDARDGTFSPFFRLFNAAGQPLTGDVKANILTETTSQTVVDVGMDATGNFVVSWLDSTGNIAARRFDPMGVARGNEFTVSDSLSGNGNPAISVSPNGSFTVIWTASGPAILAQRYSDAGFRIGDNTQVNTTAAVNSQPAIATLDSGQFLVAWLGSTGAYSRSV
jgi:hypothetical protein